MSRIDRAVRRRLLACVVCLGVASAQTAVLAQGKTGTKRETATVAPAVEKPAAPLPIAIEWPVDGAYLKAPSAAVRVRAGDEVLSVSVNGVSAARDSHGLFVAEPVALPEGTVTLRAQGASRDGRTWTTSVRVIADRSAPRITISDRGSALIGGAALKGPLEPRVTAEDLSPVTVQATLNGEPFSLGSRIAADGSYTLEVEATDRAGNVSRRTVPFRIDSRPPALSRLAPPDGTVLRGERVGISGECEDAVSVTVNGVAASVYGGRFVARDVPLAPGRNRVVIVAKDAARNEKLETLELVRDDVAPRLTITSPAGGSLLRTALVHVRGTAEDPNLAEVLVNRSRATLSGSSFEQEVRLSEGANRLTIVARDAAGNRTETTVDVTLDSTPPSLSVTSPLSGTVLAGSRIEVGGEVSDANLQEVSVNGVRAEVAKGRFRSSVALSLGANRIAVTALDRAGNSSSTAVSLTRDDQAPALSVDPVHAVTGRISVAEVTGSLSIGGASVAVNGEPADVAGSRFRISGLKLNEGVNTISVKVSDASGKTAVFNSALTIDTVPPEIVSADPADGATALASAVVPRLRFSKPIDASSVDASTIRLTTEAGGQAIPIAASVNGREISLLPNATLPERTVLRLEVSDSVTDLAGNRLRKVWTARFTTGGVAPPMRPQLDPLPAALCGRSVTFSGRTDPGARVRIDGGESPESSVARPDGSFSATVALRPESANSLRLQAFDAQGRASEPLELAVRTDCTRPRVESVTYRDGRLEVGFSEPVDAGSLTREGSIRVTPANGVVPLAAALRLENGGRTAIFADPEGTLASGATVVVDAGVRDLAGNPLSAAHVTSLAATAALLAGTTGGLSGQVFDDRVGRPLPGVIVTVVAVNGAAPTPPAPTTTTDADGRYSLVVPIGDVAIRAALDAYTATTRVSTVVADQSGAVFDIRLTPETVASAKADGSADITDRELHLTLPAAAVASGSSVRAASLSPQGLPFLPPLGWSPAGSLSFELGAVTNQPSSVTALPSPATATLTNRFAYPAGTTLLLAKYDVATRRYLRTGTATFGSGATTIQASIPSTGAWVVLVPDPAPTAPAQPALGQPFTGVATPGTDPISSATVVSVPQDVLPTQSADITATLTLSAAAPSGYPVQVLVSETLTLVNGQQMQVPSFLENLTLLRDGTGKTIVPFRVRPSATAAQVALSVGYENLVVKRYTFDLRRGNLVGSAGGTVTGPLGFTLVIPANALTQTVPVNMTQVSGAAELPFAIPAGYAYRAAVRLDFAGQTLTTPAALRWASATDPTGSGLVWIEVATLNAAVRARFAGPGRYDATNHWAETTPAAVHNLPVSGVVRSGLYVLLSATQPLAYVKGRVLDVDGTTPVASAIVTEDANSIVAVSDGLGGWSLPVPTAGTIARSSRIDTGNVGQASVPAQAAGATATVDVRLSVTAPYVLSIAPAVGTPLPLDLPVVFTLSEPLNPATVSNGSIAAISGSASIPGTVSLSPSGAQITFTPDGSWPGKSSVTLTLSSTVTDWHGYRLVDRVTKATSNYTATYNTVDPTPPTGINPLLISMSLPTGTPPTVTITGLPGAACGGCTVTAVNDTTTVTASTTALSNGSFTLTLKATTTDRVYIVIRLPSGADLYVNPGPYRVDGGRVAYVGERAADYITRDAVRITFDDRTFDGPAVLKVSPIDQASLPAPVPTLATFIAGIDFDPGEGVVAKKPINIGVPAPPGVTSGQFFVAKAIELFGEKRWMVIDTAQVVNGEITTRSTGGSLSIVLPTGQAGRTPLAVPTQDPFLCPTPPTDCCSNPPACQYPKNLLDRAVQKSQIVLMKMEATFAFIAGVVGAPNMAFLPDMSGSFTILQSYVPFAWDWRQARERDFFALPIPTGYPYTLIGRDAETGLTLFQAPFPAVTDPNNVTPLPPGTLVPQLPAPRLISASPFLTTTFVPAPTLTHAERRPLLPGIEYSYVVTSGAGVLRVYGSAGAVDTCSRNVANTCARWVDLSLVNNVRSLTTGPVNAADDGSFGALELSLNPGEDATFIAGTLSLSPLAKIRLVLSRAVVPSSLNVGLTDAGTGAAVNFSLEGDGGSSSSGLTVVTSQAFAVFDPTDPSKHRFVLTLPGGAGGLAQPLTVNLSGRPAKPIGPRDVRNVNALFLKGALLFEVTAPGGNFGDPTTDPAKLNMYDVSDPAAVTLCWTKGLYDWARGVTVDDHDRVIVSMGGGGTNGRVQIFRLGPLGSGACGGRTLQSDGEGSPPLDRPFTEITIRTGAGNLGLLPEGFPRKTEILYRELRQTITLDSETALPTFVTQLVKTDLLPSGAPDGKQDPSSPLTIIGKLPPNPDLPSPPSPPQSAYPSPLNQPVTVVNKTRGASWTKYADAGGNFTIVATASSGDLIEFRMNAAEIALVGTQGFGLQGVDLNKTIHFTLQDCRPGGAANELCDDEKRLKFSFGRDPDHALCRGNLDANGQCPDPIPTLELLNDIVLLPQAKDALPGKLPAGAEPDEQTILASVSHFGLAAFTVTGQNEDVKITQLGTGIPVGTFEIPPQYPNFFGVAAARGFPVKPVGQRKYCANDIWTNYRPTLAFLASSSGIFVVDVTKATPPVVAVTSPYGQPKVVGFFRYPSTDGVSTVFVDASRGLLYAGVNGIGAGVAVYDMTDPCTSGEAPLLDPRRIAYVSIPGLDVNVPYVIDPDSGIVFTGGDGAAGVAKAFALSLFPPPLRFVADTNRDGRWEAVDLAIPLGVENKGNGADIPGKPVEPVPVKHDPYPPDVVRVMANVMGKAGQTLTAEVFSATETGYALVSCPDPADGLGPKCATPPSGFPRVHGFLELKRQSDDPADFGYNRYVSAPIVLVADPRASQAYVRTADEDKPDNPYACKNCRIASDIAPSLGTYALDTDGQRPGTPATKPVEFWTGEKLVARLAWDATSEANLKVRATYLSGFDLARVRGLATTTRGDLTPELQQVPVLNPSLFTTEAGIAIDTHAGGARTGWTDLAIKGRGLDFVLSRFYVSDILHAGPFGRNFDSSLFARLRPLPSGDVDFYPGDGSRHTFRFVTDHFEAPAGVFLDLYRREDLTFLLVQPDQTRLFFDSVGRLTRVFDRFKTKDDGSDGNEFSFAYDGAGRLSSVLDATRRTIRFDYYPDSASTGAGLISKVTDFDNRVVNYTYDANGRLKTASGPDPLSASSVKPSTTYGWNAVSGDLRQKLFHGGELMSLTDGDSRQVFTLTYDAANLGQAKNIALGGGLWGFIYAGDTTTVTDPNGNIETYKHTASGEVQAVTAADGAVTSLGYDDEGRLTNLTRPMGGSTIFVYPAATGNPRLALGNLSSVTEFPRPGSAEESTGQTLETTIGYQPSTNLPVSIAAPTGTTSIERDTVGNPKTVIKDGSPSSYVFDARGLLKSTTDAAGVTETFTYFDSSAGLKEGYLSTRALSGAGTTTFDVDVRGNVLAATDSEGRFTSYVANKLDQVEQISRSGSQITRKFNAEGQVVQELVLAGVDALSAPVYSQTTFLVDELGRLRTRTAFTGGTPPSSQATFTYDAAGHVVGAAFSDRPGSSFTHDARGRLKTTTTGTATFTYGYDLDGISTSIATPLSRTTTYQVDGFGRHFGFTDPTGLKTSQVIDVAGRPVQTRQTKVIGPNDMLFHWTTREFDGAGRVTKETRKLFTDPIAVAADGSISPAGVTDVITATVYDAAGRVTSVTDPNGHTTFTDYDTAGRVKRVTDARQNTIEYAYDRSNNKVKETLTEKAPDGSTQAYITAFEYDAQNRLKKITDQLNQSTSFEYDARGKRTKTTDAENHVTTADYDLLGRKVKETDPNLGVTTYDYDLAGHLLHMKDPNNNQTTFTYDADGRLKTETRPDGSMSTYGYDAEGNQKTISQPNGTSMTTTFDALGRPTQVDITRGPGILGPTRITFGLDPVGRIVSSGTTGDTADVVEAFKYDSLDRLLREDQKIGTSLNRVVAKGYDLAGNATALTYPSNLSLTYDVDPLNRLSVIRQGGTWITSYRDVGARPYDKALANGIVQTFGYDSIRRLNSIVARTTSAPVTDTAYMLSPIGNKQVITRADLATKATYQFNANSWITQEALGLPIAGGTPARQLDFTIDKTLNYSQIQERTNGAITATKATAINSRNQYASFAGSPLTYDSSGNLKTFAGATLQYDHQNRLKKATASDGAIIENVYDAHGRKVRESVTVSGVTKTTDYVLSADRVIEQYTGPVLSARYVRGRGIDETIRAEIDRDGNGSLETTVYPLQDELGNVERLTDSSGGNLERYAYEGYGKLRIFSPTNVPLSASAYGWKWLFQGREYQQSLFAYDFRARTLWTELGRFGQEDPAASERRASTYQGFGGRWTSSTDPLGLYEEDVHRHLTAFLAEAAGFPANVATRIGAETQGLDNDNRSATYDAVNWRDISQHGSFGNYANEVNFHFLTWDQLIAKRRQVLELIGSREQYALVLRELGEYIHGWEDSYAHQTHPTERRFNLSFWPIHGRYGLEIGHGRALWPFPSGHAADWTWERPELALLMAKETFAELKLFCAAFGLHSSAACGETATWASLYGQIWDFINVKPPIGYVFPAGATVADYTEKIKKLNQVPDPWDVFLHRRDAYRSYLLSKTPVAERDPARWRRYETLR